MTTKELTETLERINNAHLMAPGVPYDLAWRWTGTGAVGYVEIYEEADGHILTSGPIETIEADLRYALPDWGLGWA
jgi:hypothetical protein